MQLGNVMNANPAAQFAAQEAAILLGGGKKAIERQHQKGRLTARERIAQLIDPGARFFELGLWNAWEMYADAGGAPAAKWWMTIAARWTDC